MKLGHYYLVKVTDSGPIVRLTSNCQSNYIWYKGERTQFYSLDEVREVLGEHDVLERLQPGESVFCGGFRVIKKLGWFF